MKYFSLRLLPVVSALILPALGLTGCSTAAPQAGPTAGAQPPAKTAKADAKGGAELWADNCGHCHNIRSPSSYNNVQWEIVMMHMRIRANLTAEEHKKILAFLRSAD